MVDARAQARISGVGGVHVRAGPVVAVRPLPQHPCGEREDDQPDAGLGPELEPARQLRLEGDQRHPDQDQGGRVADAPPGADLRRRADVAVLAGEQRGDRDQVVGIGGVAEAEHEREPERDEQRRPREQVGQRLVEVLDRLEQELEVHHRASAGQGRRGDRRLAVGDATVVERQQARDQDAEAALPQAGGGRAEQQPVLEDASRERDRAEAAGLRDPRQRLDGRPREGGVETGGGELDRAAGAAEVRNERRDRGARVDQQRAGALVDQRHRVSAAGRGAGAGGGGLELDRGLTLVVDLAADPAERRDGVEEPARARGQRRGEAGPAHPGDRLPVAGLDQGGERAGRALRRLSVPERRQPRAGHPPRLPHGRVAARQPDREEEAGAFVAADAADEQLPAPDRAVGTEAGAVVDRAGDGAELAVLGGRSGEVGVVVLDADQGRVRARARVPRRQVVGMEIVRDDAPGRARAGARSERRPRGTRRASRSS